MAISGIVILVDLVIAVVLAYFGAIFFKKRDPSRNQWTMFGVLVIWIFICEIFGNSFAS